MGLAKYLALFIMIMVVSYVVYMCIVTSQQVQLIIHRPSNVTGLVINCTDPTTGRVYPCMLCISINMTVLTDKPTLATWDCSLNITYVRYYTYRNVIDKVTNISITLPWTGLRYIAKSGGKGSAGIIDVTLPVLAYYIADTKKYKLGEYVTKTGVTLRPVFIIPRYIPIHPPYSQYADNIQLSTRLNYVLLVPAKDVEISKILYGGYETTKLRDFGFIVLVFTRYASSPVDSLFQTISKMIGLSQPYKIVLPSSTLVIEEYTYRLNITVSYFDKTKNRTVTGYMTYTVSYTYSKCLSDICYTAYLAYLQYPSLVPEKLNGSGIAHAYVTYSLINQRPTPTVELHGLSTRYGNSTPSIVVVKIFGNMGDVGILPEMAYLNLSKIPYTDRSLSYLLYIPTSSYIMHMYDLGLDVVDVDKGKLENAINRSSTSLTDLLTDVGIPAEYASYIAQAVSSDIARKYGVNATVSNVRIMDADYTAITISYRAEIYIPGNVDYVPIIIAYTCNSSTCTLRIRIVPS